MSTELTDPDEYVASAIGRIMAFWGFRRNLGKIWSLLFLAPEPMTAAELCDRLGLSTGSVSMALKELQRWGAIRKRDVAGERREHYEAESDIWGTVARVMEQRELREVAQVLGALETATRSADTRIAEAAATGDDSALIGALHRKARIRELEELAMAGKDLLDLVIKQEAVGDLTTDDPDGSGIHRKPRIRIPRAPSED
ncbi:MAG: MarR family transcriptional regulator [Proteobacteria bacterium]|nr:MarR family transcriptional regulator [Pseudomonadota bacterium]